MANDSVQQMVEHVSWMSPVDYKILRFFNDLREAPRDMSSTPFVIGHHIDYENNYVGKRCRALTKAGLLERVDEGLYALTDDGERFLDGDLDVDEVEQREPN